MSAQPAILDIEPAISAPVSGSQVQAIAAAPGIAIGPAHIQTQQVFDYPLRGESAAIERQRLHAALTEVRADIQGLIERSQS
ncbi:phosphoenolpyruvate-utilizing N-terminal domain-containing protein, partial [Salmonella enterica]|uniref:phosphoenolpyruvate-utilizing N-terminal domain-containing protein n=1 Tax=Salmonella enterica TaxID=28901 RepID=UPI0022B6A91B